MIYVNWTWNFRYSPRYHYCSVDLQNKIPINTTGIFFKNSHIQNLMVSENSIPHKRNSKKKIFSWSESIEIFMIKFCKLYVLLIKSLKLRSYFFSSLVFFFKYFPLQYSTRPWLSNNTIFSNNWIKNCGLIALIKQVATQLLTKNSKRLQIVRYQRLSCEDKLYTIKFT